MNWLLLRGLSRERRHWGAFPRTLEAHVPGARVRCLDLPGTGVENERPTPATIRGIADDVRARWNVLREELGGSWNLLGISLGGMVAMQWCADHPADFERVVLVNTSAGNLSPPWKRMRPSVLPSAGRILLAADPLERERRVLRATTRLQTDLDAVAREWATYAADRPVARGTILRQLFAAMRFRAPSSLPVPALVLCGGRDPFTDPACQRDVASHFGATLEVHPDGGHELAVDASEWIAGRIAAWAAGIEARVA